MTRKEIERNKVLNRAFLEGYKLGVQYGKESILREEKITPNMLREYLGLPPMGNGDHQPTNTETRVQERIAEQEGIYLSTTLRLTRMGKKTPQEQIVALAEEIDYYRSRIRALENFIEQRPTKENTR